MHLRQLPACCNSITVVGTLNEAGYKEIVKHRVLDCDKDWKGTRAVLDDANFVHILISKRNDNRKAITLEDHLTVFITIA